METYNENAIGNKPPGPPAGRHRSGRVMGGIFIIAIGLILLARQAGMDVPRWVFSFEGILIAVGLYLGFRHSFRGFAWMIPVIIGGFLLIDDFYPYYDFKHFIWPVIIIGVGVFMVLRGGKKNYSWKAPGESQSDIEYAGEDILDSTVVFGGVKKNIISKNFRGGEAVTVFGGTEINLTQADVLAPIVLDLTQVFGGTKLIVPAHWKIQSQDLVAIFGGIDDKRPPVSSPGAEETTKVLILKGTCLLGGIEIKSY